MAQTIKLKRSATTGNAPTTSQLALGELGINTTDGKLFLKKSVSGTESIVEVGGLPLSGGTLTGNLSLGDNVKLQLGNQSGGDLQIYHDGNHSRIVDAGTGYLILGGQDTGVAVQNGSGQNLILTGANAVTLGYGNAPKLATTSTGIDVTGSVTADGLTVDTGSTFAVSATLGHTGGSQLFFVNDDGGSRNQIDSQKNSASADLDLATGGVKRQKIASNGDISFYNDSAAQGLFWDSSTSRLGLGVTNPAQLLHLTSTGFAYARLNNSSYTGIDIGQHTNGNTYFNLRDNKAQVFLTNNTERVRINADGSSVFSGAVSATKAGYNANGSAWAESAYASSGSYGGGYSIIDGSAGFLLHAQSSGTQFVIRQGTVGSNPSTLLTMNSSGNLNLTNGSLMVGATTAPSGLVHVASSKGSGGDVWTQVGAGNTSAIHIQNTANAANTNAVLYFRNSVGEKASVGARFVNQSTGETELRFSTTNSSGTSRERVTIDGDGRVGIGTNNPSQKLHVVGTSRPALFGSDTAVNIVKLYNSATGSGTYNGLDLLVNSTANSQINAYGMPLTFGTSASNGTNVTERMRISSDGSCRWTPDGTNHDMTLTSSGDLLVGKTSSAFGTAGVQASASNGLWSTRSNFPPLALNRLSSDGSIVDFYKDGTNVGSISTKDGDLNIGTGACGIRFNDGVNAVIPFSITNNFQVDNTLDLGYPTLRFKDLYLSNNATAQKLTLTKDPVGTYSIEVDGTNTGQPNLIVKQSTNERFRCDNNGNLLVGKTNNALANDGVVIREGGEILATNTSDLSANFNRLSTDGGIVGFYKDGTTVGTIGTIGGKLHIDGPSNNSGLRFHESSLIPRKNGDVTNGQVDLGYNDGSIILGFRNLTLSNAIKASTLKFENSAGTTEYARFSGGNLLVGTTSAYGTTGTTINAAGLVYSSADGDRAGQFDRTTSDGEIVRFSKAGTTVGSIGTVSGDLYIGTGDTTLKFEDGADRIVPRGTDGAQRDGAISLGSAGNRFNDLYLAGSVNIGDAKTVGHGAISLKYDLVYMTAGVISPSNSDGTDNDNSVDLGKSAARFNDIFATNGTIQTSDRNEKQDIESLTEAEERVAVAAKGLLKKFRWKSAVEDKGDDARIHFGIIAQDLQDAFEAEGLDAGRYGMFTSNTWTNEDGEEQTRMGVRYSELLAFIISAI